MTEPDFDFTLAKDKPGRIRLTSRAEPYRVRINGYDLLVTVPVEPTNSTGSTAKAVKKAPIVRVGPESMKARKAPR